MKAVMVKALMEMVKKPKIQEEIGMKIKKTKEDEIDITAGGEDE